MGPTRALHGPIKQELRTILVTDCTHKYLKKTIVYTVERIFVIYTGEVVGRRRLGGEGPILY